MTSGLSVELRQLPYADRNTQHQTHDQLRVNPPVGARVDRRSARLSKISPWQKRSARRSRANCPAGSARVRAGGGHQRRREPGALRSRSGQERSPAPRPVTSTAMPYNVDLVTGRLARAPSPTGGEQGEQVGPGAEASPSRGRSPGPYGHPADQPRGTHRDDDRAPARPRRWPRAARRPGPGSRPTGTGPAGAARRARRPGGAWPARRSPGTGRRRRSRKPRRPRAGPPP